MGQEYRGPGLRSISILVVILLALGSLVITGSPSSPMIDAEEIIGQTVLVVETGNVPPTVEPTFILAMVYANVGDHQRGGRGYFASNPFARGDCVWEVTLLKLNLHSSDSFIRASIGHFPFCSIRPVGYLSPPKSLRRGPT